MKKGGLSHDSSCCVGSAHGVYIDAEGRGDMQICTLRDNNCDVTSPDDEDVGVRNVICLV